MSQNPFDALGGGDLGGGLDLGALMQQAQQMQHELQAAQQRLAETIVEGSVAGGAVTVSVSGVGELTGVTIKPEAVQGTDEESLADLGDLVVAAFRDARTRIDELAAETLGPLAGGLGGGDAGPGAAPGRLGF
ncbi:YbaB/EbfC family nucleoid-associated protein [Nocardioides sp. zg-536]|uniref:Nucleoid-associated protein JK386_13910 n=1 Tax=Nocardioides faecalis TaxID=2803858 RepID=A0A939BWT8_9ACTN|nr:YbaB/EbfC family nucleoid-associated protein [Nocardioides faecalis]MBM9460992.1 YbaB/EbfC family nucleoid-associated protein [Nocardioides faecalis]QVI59088.1 YbaB/EbfC family nucleoid-associated protein [Nocardioides faecalis]